MACRQGARDRSETPAQRHLLQSHRLGRQRRTQAVGTQRCHRTLHRTHNQRAHIRQQPRGLSACSTAQRPHHRMEHRNATDARRRPMGSVYPGGNGLRQTVATRHSRRLHTNLRHGVAQRILTALFVSINTKSTGKNLQSFIFY